ncbi:MAG: aspartate aminotransferase family protein [Acidimicrobiia bacterium]|nr:aspartate aminotransferase family protein [Acidimicrobiia bacterium]
MTAQPEVTGSHSEELYERAKQVLPGGVSRNTVLRSPHPVYVDRAEGCRVTDIEGTTRIDFANNMAALIHGHSHPVVTKSVISQLQRGTAFSLGTEVEVAYAEHLCSRNEGFEKLRFVNSGTEAVMSALKAARAYTGRAKIAKVEGAYHGGYDYAEVSQTSTPANWGKDDSPASVPVAYGTPAKALEDVVVIPFNDTDKARAILDRHGDEIACVLVDVLPHRVGLLPASFSFMEMLRQWTEKNGALLVLDEVITFRSKYGGAQEWYEMQPDITALGKIIGGGFPVGALAGTSEIMDVMNPLLSTVRFPHSGTFSANPVTMTAGLAAMRLFDRAAVERTNKLGYRARSGIEDAIRAVGAPACVTGGGSMFRVHMKPKLPHNYREAFSSAAEQHRLKFMLDHLFESGFIVINTCAFTISTAMGEAEIDALVEAMEVGFRKLAAAS